MRSYPRNTSETTRRDVTVCKICSRRTTIPCFSLTLPSPFSVPSHVISVKAFRWRTRSDHVTRKTLAARNNEACGQGNGRQSFRTVFRYHYKHWTREFCYWPFSHTRARNGLSVGDWPVYSPHHPLAPPQTTLLRFFLRGVGGSTPAI